MVGEARYLKGQALQSLSEGKQALEAYAESARLCRAAASDEYTRLADIPPHLRGPRGRS